MLGAQAELLCPATIEITRLPVRRCGGTKSHLFSATNADASRLAGGSVVWHTHCHGLGCHSVGKRIGNQVENNNEKKRLKARGQPHSGQRLRHSLATTVVGRCSGAPYMNQERNGSIGYARCEECRGNGKKPDGTSCTNCWGTGLVAVSQEPTAGDTPPVQSSNRRRFPRYDTDLPVRLRDQQEQEFAGRCVVLGEGGLAAILSEVVPSGSVVTLRLSIPAHPTALEPYAFVRNQLGLRHGFEFVSLTDAERVAIRQFCSGLRTQADDRRGSPS